MIEDLYSYKLWYLCYVSKGIDPSIVSKIARNAGLDIKVSIPLIKIPVKKVKNKVIYDENPLLFNYGFVQLPLKIATSRERLIEVKNMLDGIVSWFYIPTKGLSTYREYFYRKHFKKLVPHDYPVKLPYPKIKHVSNEDVTRLMSYSDKVEDLYSSEQLKSLKIGDSIILRNYPFEGIEAQILEIRGNNVKVNISVFGVEKIIKIDLSNILYTAYDNYSEQLPGNMVYLEEINYKFI